MKKEIIVLGDVEMGIGNKTDDFISDQTLSKLILSLVKRKHSVELVFNGDTFDFLKAPIMVNGKEKFPRHITKDVSLNKLSNIYKAHKNVFNALKTFLKNKQNKVFFVIGNHDLDLNFKEVQQKIRYYIGKNAKFDMSYQYKTVHVEHGQEFDLINKMGLMQPFANYRGKKILNLPWVSLGVIDKMTHLKNNHPFLERIFSRTMLFHHYKKIRDKVRKRSVMFALKSFFSYPRLIIGPNKRVSIPLVKEAFRRFRQVNYELKGVMDVFMNELLGKPQKTQIHVLGHVHIKRVEKKAGLVFIHPDTWRDEYDITKSGLLKPKQKNYVQFIIDNDKTSWKIRTIPTKRTTWKFSDLVKDEIKYLELARKEEGYTTGMDLKKKRSIF